MSHKALSFALAFTLGLAACGGGDGDGGAPPSPDNTVPASATASPQAYSRYVASLVDSETAEPLDVSRVVPPVSETEEPLVL